MLERIDYEYREELPGLPAPERPACARDVPTQRLCLLLVREAGPLRLLGDIGDDNVMWETDFPHPTCLYPSPVERTAAVIGHLDPDVVRKIMQDNAAKLYQIELPS